MNKLDVVCIAVILANTGIFGYLMVILPSQGGELQAGAYLIAIASSVVAAVAALMMIRE
jgi:hypothetical protein